MQAQDFIRKCGPGGPAFKLNERAGAQAHFIDLCRLLGMAEPGDADNPPLLVVSDRLMLEIHTHFTGTPSERHVFALADIAKPEVQQRLRQLWEDPEAFKPRRSNRDITEAAAQTFAGTAERLRAGGVAPEAVSHFLSQCVFCFFAEDVGLLPNKLFERLVGVKLAPDVLRAQLAVLFETMKNGGLFGVEAVPWFNGGLFKTVAVPPLAPEDVAAMKAASAFDWSAIDPSIFGTLFERGLDPSKRSQLGAHYTEQLRAAYKSRVPGGADVVCYWFEKARAQIEAGDLQRAGLVSTNSIRGGKNREVLDQICASTRIFEAWSDEAWVNHGAAVQASQLDGLAATSISADLAAQGLESEKGLSAAVDLRENRLTAFNGIQKTGPFDVSGELARAWVRLPSNADGSRNCTVVSPYRNGIDMTRRHRDMWVLDFGRTMSVEAAALFEAPYGWTEADPAALSDDEVLRRLLALNLSRAAAEAGSLRAQG